MSSRWETAIQVAADALGEMLVAMANGEAEYLNEDMAAAVLKTGLGTLLADGPDAERTAAAAGVLYTRLHDAQDQTWGSLHQGEQRPLPLPRPVRRTLDTGAMRKNVPVERLGEVVASLRDEGDRISAAVDRLRTRGWN